MNTVSTSTSVHGRRDWNSTCVRDFFYEQKMWGIIPCRGWFNQFHRRHFGSDLNILKALASINIFEVRHNGLPQTAGRSQWIHFGEVFEKKLGKDGSKIENQENNSTPMTC